jgi:enamine deaminase RidA (YjgF/YER057c/UK114 family)
MKLFNPKSIAPPNGTYSHGALLPQGAELLYVAGQVAIKPDGSIPATLEEQAEVVWTNVLAVLAEGGMSASNLVKINSYITRAEDFARFAAIRAKYLGNHRPASTLVVVSALANPKFLVEVEGVAARR